MDQVLRRLPYCFVYLDDLFIAIPDMETHLQHLQQVFQLLSDHGIMGLINAQKSEFTVPSLDFLGHRVSATGITPLSSNVLAIMDYPQPTTTSQLRQFLGLVNFYHRFVPHCAGILQPLHSLLNSTKIYASHMDAGRRTNFRQHQDCSLRRLFAEPPSSDRRSLPED